MPKSKKYKNMKADMSLKMADGTLKPLMTFTFAVPCDKPDMMALSLVKFEEDMIKQYIKFEYSEESNGESSS